MVDEACGLPLRRGRRHDAELDQKQSAEESSEARSALLRRRLNRLDTCPNACVTATSEDRTALWTRACSLAAGDSMRRSVIVGMTLVLSSVTAKPAEHHKAHPAKKYVKNTFSPFVVLRAGAGAAIEQARNVPHEWGQGAGGFGKRLGSALGKHLVNNSIHLAVAEMRHEEIGYRPSGKKHFGPRLKYALVSTVVTRKTTTGKKTVATGELAGAFGSGIISRAWQPASTRSIALGFESGGITLGVDAGTHVLHEFWPDIRHPHRHRHSRYRSPRAG